MLQSTFDENDSMFDKVSTALTANNAAIDRLEVLKVAEQVSTALTANNAAIK